MQTLAACMYCNSTIRITPGAAPVAVRAMEVPPEVIDAVKAKLLLGQEAAAIEDYAKAAQVDSAAATTAVKAIARTMAYYPPLRGYGVVIFIVLDVFGLVGILGGSQLLQRGNWLVGMLVVVICALFTAANTLLLARGLPGYVLGLRGTPAQARVLKTWQIRTAQVRGEPVELTRLLLEVRPAGGRPYQAEANIYVREVSRQKFAPGAVINVKFDPTAPKQVVVVGPAKAEGI
jgi:hypothetical protein